MIDDPYLPGPETPAGQEIRLAAGFADFAHHRRRISAYTKPAFFILGLGVVVALLVVLVHLL